MTLMFDSKISILILILILILTDIIESCDNG
jgi:hypothetical protein